MTIFVVAKPLSSEKPLLLGNATGLDTSNRSRENFWNLTVALPRRLGQHHARSVEAPTHVEKTRSNATVVSVAHGSDVRSQTSMRRALDGRPPWTLRTRQRLTATM